MQRREAPPPAPRVGGVDLLDPFGLHLAPVQRRAEAAPRDGADVQAAAAAGLTGAATALPFAEQIARSFGPDHDLAGIRAHVGGPASDAAHAIGASAYATGNAVAFANAPDLHTAAHEAAHVVQQRHGVSLKGGVGQVGDPYEQHADAVADRVVAGQSAADLLASGPGSGAIHGAVQRRPAAGSAKTPPMNSALLRSAATDLERLGARMMVPIVGAMVSIPEAVTELTAIVRRIAHAAAGATEREDPEFENLAGVVRSFVGNVPPTFVRSPEFQEAVAVLQEELGLAMARTDYAPSLEPVRSQKPLDDDQQAVLARKLLADAISTLAAANTAPPGRDDSGLYHRTAAEAAGALGVVGDLIEGHVPAGKARLAFAESVLAASEEIMLVDRWVRSVNLPDDPTIARLYAAERDLRAIVGLEPVARTAMATIDAQTAGDQLLRQGDEGQKAKHVGTYETVRNALEEVLQSIDDAINAFAARPQSQKAPADDDLFKDLINVAVDAALGGSLVNGARKAIVAAGRAAVGSESESDFPEQLLAIAWRRGEQWLASSGYAVTSEGDLHRGYVEGLRAKFRGAKTEIRMGLSDSAERLGHVNPASLASLAEHLRGQTDPVGAEALFQYVLGWQNLRARNHEGTPEAPRGAGMSAADVHSEKDAALSPAFTAGVPGVLHVRFPINPASPRVSKMRPGSASVEGMSAAHLAALRAADDRPLRELGLNTSIRVTYGDSDLGGVDLLWFPDGGTIKVGWERMDWSRAQLGDARHLQAFARGVAIDDRALEHATHEDAIEGAKMIADAAMEATKKWAFKEK